MPQGIAERAAPQLDPRLPRPPQHLGGQQPGTAFRTPSPRRKRPSAARLQPRTPPDMHSRAWPPLSGATAAGGSYDHQPAGLLMRPAVEAVRLVVPWAAGSWPVACVSLTGPHRPRRRRRAHRRPPRCPRRGRPGRSPARRRRWGVLRRRRSGSAVLGRSTALGQLLLRAQRCWRLRRRSALLVMLPGAYTHRDGQRAPRSRCRRRDEVRAGLPG
jgi:hypothetical protein